MVDKYSLDYIQKSKENKELFDFLATAQKFNNWQIVAIFYSALCQAKAYLYSKNIPINSINSHDTIKGWLAKETESKRLGVLKYYEILYKDSRDARYTTKRITQERINNALKNYEIVIKYLQIK